MPYTALTPQVTTRAGIAPSYTAALVDGHAVDNASEKIILHVKNSGGAAMTVTIGGTKAIDGRTLPALTISVPAGGERMIGPFPKALYNAYEADTDIDEAITIDYSAVAGVTIAAFKVGNLSY